MLVAFRSIVIAVKAIVLNLLSVAAAYGVLVLVFQHGFGKGLLGFSSTAGIDPVVPLLLFVILFGLSMDYHVFILSRIREAFDRGANMDDAIAHGIKSTAGVVTSAAVVMVGVFSIFATLSMLMFKQFGVGLATAILIDATIVRARAPARDDEAARRLELVPAAVAPVAADGRAFRLGDRPRDHFGARPRIGHVVRPRPRLHGAGGYPRCGVWRVRFIPASTPRHRREQSLVTRERALQPDLRVVWLYSQGRTAEVEHRCADEGGLDPLLPFVHSYWTVRATHEACAGG